MPVACLNVVRRKAAFTLIELLVVVAILALLISILLPSLTGAREQARQTKCLANLKGIGAAMQQYFLDNRDWFPFDKRPFPHPGWAVSAFHYGGHPGRPGLNGPSGGPDGSNTFTLTGLRDTFAGRPFNSYMFTGLYSVLETMEDAKTPKFEERRRVFDDAFGCPSDRGAQGSNTAFGDNGATQGCVYFNGASYDINYHWVWQWAARIKLSGAPYKPYESDSPKAEKDKYLARANRFLGHQRTRAVSRFVVLYEDRFDGPLLQKKSITGWHRKLNRHSFLFLDAHAANMVADPTKGPDGPGWKTSSGPWYEKPDNPDYDLRGL